MIFSGASRFGLLLAGPRWRWLVAAFVASLVLVGVSAWGVESAHAGLYKDVQLTVRNDAKKSVYLELCSGPVWTGGDYCPYKAIQLAPGQAVSHTSEDVNGTMGFSIVGPGWAHSYFCDFAARNPAIGAPYFKLKGKSGNTSYTDYPLSEGDTKGPIFCGYFDVVVHRKDDTSVKVMQINIAKLPDE